jgi:DNA-binding NarL/FixJ family response regulator
VRVVLAEDHGLFLDSLTGALAARRVEVVGRARHASEALDIIDRSAPDVAVLDIRMAPTFTDEGLAVAEQARSRYPDVGLLVLSSYAEVTYAERLLNMEEDSRALGYLIKERVGNLDDLVDALSRVAAGEVVIDSLIIDRLMKRRRRPDPLDHLTPQERRILALVAEGRSNLGIAQQLDCQISTVEKHLTVINGKLGLLNADTGWRRHVNTRVLAALAFLRSHTPPT